MYLIVRAADYAMTESITDGCLRAARTGVLTDVGLMTNDSVLCSRAVEEMKKYPHVSFGEDLNLVSGKPCTEPSKIPHLVDDDGIFLSSRVRKRTSNFDIPYEEAYLEMKNQVERFIALVGHVPSYITGHSLSTPEVDRAMDNIITEYGCDYDVFSLPTAKRWYFKNMVVDPGDRKTDYSYDAQGKTDVLGHILNNEVQFDFENMKYALLATHAGYCDGDLMNMSTFNVIRGRELEAICSPKIKEWAIEHGIEFINFDQCVALMKAEGNDSIRVPAERRHLH